MLKLPLDLIKLGVEGVLELFRDFGLLDALRLDTSVVPEDLRRILLVLGEN